ncbi:MAG: very short patch repair endonuclease [Planctomycetes bacterium]|nr:very short patch repair endonuclease [Planctomycetota bacterium]
MTDIMSKAKRSALMARIRGTNTTVETRVFRALRRQGVYFARHVKGLPGRPDVVFRNGKVAVFLDGDFWHGWRFGRWEYKLQPFWRAKIATNRARDASNFARLRRQGWKVLRIWEHELERDLARQVERILDAVAARRRG